MKKYIVELGLGSDFHGQDVTKAAKKAAKDAISHSCLCGLEGEIHNESGKYSFTFPAEQLEHAHDTLSGKFIHGNDIKENTGKKIANMQTEKYKARQAAYRAFITATVPEKG